MKHAQVSSFWPSAAVPPMISPGESSALQFKADNSIFSVEERIYPVAISAVLSGVGQFGNMPRTSMK